jgi:predicted ABC-type ATPase
MPRLYIISGCNGAGKTTASYTMLPEMLECSEFVNSDEFAKGLSPFQPEKASIQASRYMITKIRYLLKRQRDFGIETTLATRTLLKTIRMAQAAGYTVTLLYFWLNSPELAIERVAARVETGGHNIPEETIRRRYRVGIDYFFHDYAPICERWILADNSQIPFRVIAEGSKNDLINIKDETTYDKIRTQAFERHAEVIREQMEHKARNSNE